jgi:hypothetical protein
MQNARAERAQQQAPAHQLQSVLLGDGYLQL